MSEQNMSEQEIQTMITAINKKIQTMADSETQAAWSKFMGITSESIEKITGGCFTEEKMRLIAAVDSLLDELAQN
jgi:hypothetical protein